MSKKIIISDLVSIAVNDPEDLSSEDSENECNIEEEEEIG